MANIKKVKTKRAAVMVELDAPLEGEHELRFTMEAFGEMEEEYGSVKDAIEQTKTGKMKPIAFMIWAGLLYNFETPEALPLRKVEKAIQISDLDYYIGKVADAMAMDLPEEELSAPNEITPKIEAIK